MNLTEIIGKQVFDIYSANFLGTVHDANFDKNFTKVVGLYFFDQEENEYYIKAQNIYAVFDFVTIKNLSKISHAYTPQNSLLPLGKKIVDITGKDLGNVCDLELDANFQIVSFVSDKQKIEPAKIMQIGTFVVVGDKKIWQFCPKNKKILPELASIKVSVMKMESQTTPKLMPNKVTISSDILLGKKLSKDIIGKNNELILKQNQIISQKHILLAKQHDKLNELFYSVY